MTEADAAAPAAGSRAAWFQDWITIWHSELAAGITDRDTQETLLRLLDLWAASARQMAAVLDGAGALAPPWPAPAAAVPDGRDAAIAGLLARVAELERRLDAAAPRS